MGHYSGGLHGERSSGGPVMKFLGIPLILLAGCAFAAFVWCRSRVDRRYYQDELSRARFAETVREMDAALLPEFEKEEMSNTRARYTARPKATGLCGCSPVMVDVVDITYDGSGQIVKKNVSQSLGMARR